MIEDKIYQAINSAVKCAYLDVTGDGRHFDAVVVSDEFIGKTRIMRHRYVHNILDTLLKQEVHALSMKLYTQEEWSKQ